MTTVTEVWTNRWTLARVIQRLNSGWELYDAHGTCCWIKAGCATEPATDKEVALIDSAEMVVANECD